MTTPLPDMPLSAADIFVCRTSDLEYKTAAGEAGARAAPIVRPGRWLVLELCRRCDRDQRRYCRRHDMRPRY